MALAKAMEPGLSVDLDRMAESARDASEFLKALAHESRLLILCNLEQREVGRRAGGVPKTSPVDRLPATGAAAPGRTRCRPPRREDDLLQHRQRQGALSHGRAL